MVASTAGVSVSYVVWYWYWFWFWLIYLSISSFYIETGIVTINNQNPTQQSVEYNVEYYGLGHFSKFFSYPSFRIDSTTTTTNNNNINTSNNECINATAFLNEGNQSIHLVVLNSCSDEQVIQILWTDQQNNEDYSIPSYSVVSGLTTFVWTIK